MHDQPSAGELLDAIAAFLKEEVVGALDGRARFHALVAANSTAIVRRELELGPAHRAAELARLEELAPDLGESGADGSDSDALRCANRRLCERIDAGDADHEPLRRAVIDHLKATVADQLKIDNPKFDLDVRAE